MKPGYYVDVDDCLWIVYPDRRPETHLSCSIEFIDVDHDIADVFELTHIGDL